MIFFGDVSHKDRTNERNDGGLHSGPHMSNQLLRNQVKMELKYLLPLHPPMLMFLFFSSCLSPHLLSAAVVFFCPSLSFLSPSHSPSPPFFLLFFIFVLLPSSSSSSSTTLVGCVWEADKEWERKTESPSALFGLRGVRNFQWLSLSAVMDKACSRKRRGGSAQDSSPSYPLFSHCICLFL